MLFCNSERFVLPFVPTRSLTQSEMLHTLHTHTQLTHTNTNTNKHKTQGFGGVTNAHPYLIYSHKDGSWSRVMSDDGALQLARRVRNMLLDVNLSAKVCVYVFEYARVW